MCQSWGMELTGMVGVGNQEATGPGATACVCEPPGKKDATRVGASGSASNTAAVVVAIQQAQQQAAQQSRPK